MALTIVTQPGFIASAYRPLIFKVESDVVNAELQLRCRIIARNDITAGYDLIATKYEKRYMDQSYFIIDISNILQSLLTFDRNEVVTGLTSPCNNSILEYKMTLSEVYYNSEGVMTTYDEITTQRLRACNSIPQHEEAQNLSAYTLSAVGGIAQQMQKSNDFSPDFA